MQYTHIGDVVMMYDNHCFQPNIKHNNLKNKEMKIS